jgi:hypothetical protein
MPRRPFPATPELKRELHAAIIREGGGELLKDVSKWREQFPGAKLVSIKVGNLDIGPPHARESSETFTRDHMAMRQLRANLYGPLRLLNCAKCRVPFVDNEKACAGCNAPRWPAVSKR